mgnify:CR=1 FL=1
MKKIKNKKKIIIAVATVTIMLLAYYIYYKNSNTYKEFEKSSKIEELIPYEEEKQENRNNKSNSDEEWEGSENDTDLNSSEGNEGDADNKVDEDNISEDEKADEKPEGEEVSSESIASDAEKQTNSKGKDKNANRNEEMMMVHITGEVKNWGVIELPQGSRVIDAVNKAGGFTESADTAKVNLAYELTDGVKIYIPSKNEEEMGKTTTQEYITSDSGNNVITGGNDMKKETKSELVNINNATQTELETLPGIGPSTALKIISYRNENGKFSSIDDIKNVSGIGNSKFESIRELICV